MSKPRKLLLSLVVVGVAGSIAGLGAFSAFSSQTENPGNSFTAGTVALSDNDAGSAMYSVANRRPGDTEQKCIKVTYTGSLDADVKLYVPGAIGAIGPYVNLTVEGGTQPASSFPDCTGFAADGGPLFTGTLAGFAAAHNSWASGLADNPGTSATKWSTGDAVVYRVTVSLQDDDAAQGLSSGAHTFRWEARNE